MYIFPASPSRLADIRDRLSTARPLKFKDADDEEDDDIVVAARGFACCNCAAALTEFAIRVISASHTEVAPSLKYRDICDWLSQETAPDAEQIIALAADEEQDLRQFEPWLCIDRWAAIDAILCSSRTDDDEVAAPAAGFPQHQALTILHEILLSACDELDSDACCVRSPVVVQHFTAYWCAVRDCLENLLRRIVSQSALTTFGSLSEMNLRRTFLAELLEKLRMQPAALMVGLTMRKYQQIENCVQSIKNRAPLPALVHAGQLAKVYGEMRSASLLRKEFSLDAERQTFLLQLLNWCAAHRLETLHKVNLEHLWTIAQQPTIVVLSGDALKQVMEGWTHLAHLVHMRYLPRDWGERPMIQDFFAHPMRRDFEFEDWVAQMSGFGFYNVEEPGSE